jgi:hypothetical protein
MLTRDAALRVADMFRKIGFTKVEIDEFGFGTGCYSVRLWSVNASAGNRNMETVEFVPTEKEAALIVKKAKGKANSRDIEAFCRMKAEKECCQS